MYSQRIVVTGVGVVSPAGNDARTFWTSLAGGRSAVAPVGGFCADGARPSYAAEVKDFAPDRAGLPRRKLKIMGRHAQLAFAAVREACAAADLAGDAPAVSPRRLGVVLGVGMLNADVMELGRAFHATAQATVDIEPERFDPVLFGRAGAPQLFPLWLLRHIPNLAAAHASIAIDAQGPSNTITTGCVAGANAIGEAARVIARGDADVIVAGGADARVCPLAMLRYRELGWLATRDDVEPAEVSAPFDESATGFVTGEAAAVVVLESLDHARARGVRIRAELAGYGAANDAYDLMRPHPEGRGLARAISRCLDRSDLTLDETSAVFAPATGVPPFDRAVATAFERVMPAGARRPPITATRSILGHTHAASAALDCVAAVNAINDSRLPPTINLHRPIADLPFVADTALETDVTAALVAAYGFGGHAAALALRRYAE